MTGDVQEDGATIFTRKAGNGIEPPLEPPGSKSAVLGAKPRWAGLLLKGHRALIRTLACVQVEGVEHIPRSGPLIVASNHVNWLDLPFTIGMTGDAFGHLPGRMGFAAAYRWKKLFHLYFKLIGEPVYFRKGMGELSELEQLTTILQAGGMIALAPEGTFNRGALIRAKMGVVRLAVDGSAPVLPVVIYGQRGALRRWRSLRRLQVNIRIGPVVEIARDAVNQVARQRETDRVMEALAKLLPPAYRGVYAYVDKTEGDS
jgi:1-acyl-sn-glycerol-3-phosphate acyltransferase